MRRLRTIFILSPMLTLVGCVAPAPSPPPQPARATALPVAPPPVAGPAPSVTAWTERALTPGGWSYRSDARGGLALYGVGGQDAALVIRCDKAAQRIFISRPGTGAGSMTLRATTGALAYPARPAGGTPPYVAAELGVLDRQLDAIAFSRGRFLVAMAGTPDVIIPAWPEVARTIEECRS